MVGAAFGGVGAAYEGTADTDRPQREGRHSREGLGSERQPMMGKEGGRVGKEGDWIPADLTCSGKGPMCRCRQAAMRMCR